MEQERDYVVLQNVEADKELYKKLKSCDEVEISFIVHDGCIKESVLMCSGEGLMGFLAHTFLRMMEYDKRGVTTPEGLMILCADAINVAAQMLDEKKEGKN